MPTVLVRRCPVQVFSRAKEGQAQNKPRGQTVNSRRRRSRPRSLEKDAGRGRGRRRRCRWQLSGFGNSARVRRLPRLQATWARVSMALSVHSRRVSPQSSEGGAGDVRCFIVRPPTPQSQPHVYIPNGQLPLAKGSASRVSQGLHVRRKNDVKVLWCWWRAKRNFERKKREKEKRGGDLIYCYWLLSVSQ
jgi:hypothetical protein